MTVLDAFVARRERAAELVDQLAGALDELALDGNSAAPLRGAADRARHGRFAVLLLGSFSTGKSTLLNALLGQPVLPAKVNPCTAIRTEVHHAAEPTVAVHHRDGTVEALDPADFGRAWQLSTSDVSAAGDEASDRFGHIDRAVIGWPLPLLENGVVLLDTPGLDDDPARTARTLAALPDADAVIVVLSATRFLTELERRTVRRDLLPLGLRNLFFPVTMVDLLDDLSADPEAELAALMKKGREVLGPLCEVDGTDRFDDRFFPLDARTALLSRWDRAAGERVRPDADALAATGMPAFEEALESFLVTERGQAQLAHLHEVAARARDALAQRSELDRATAHASLEELKQRQEQLEPQLTELKAISGRVGRVVDDFVVRQQALVWQDLRAFLAECERDLPTAITSFDLGPVAGFDLLTPGGRARVQAALRTALDAWLEERVTEWQANLRPKVEAALDGLRDELAAEAADFDALAETIALDFAGGVIRSPSTADGTPEPGTVERWFSVAVGALLLSPGAVAAGWVDGYEGALKGAASRLGVRLAVIALGALLGPVGWAGLVLYAVSDVILVGLTGGSQLRSLKRQVATGLQGKLVAQADAAREAIDANVAEGLAPLRDALVQAARNEADQLADALQDTIVAREQAAADAAVRAEAYTAALARFDEALVELKTLRDG